MSDSLLKNLFMLERDYNYYINDRLREFKIKKNDIRIIKTINQNVGISQNEICTLLKEDKVTVAKSIKKLEDKGYIKRARECEDKRIASIYLTDEGHIVREEIMKIFDDLHKILMKELSLEEENITTDLLSKISKNMSKESNRLK